MKTICIVQARLGSQRLPKKVLMDLGGKPLISHVAERACAIPGVDVVVVAVPVDDLSTVFAVALSGDLPNVHLFGSRTSEGDVLARYQDTAEALQADVILRVTCDCPFLDPAVAGYVLSEFHKLHVDIATNDTTCSGYFDGTDVEVFTRAILNQAHKEAVEVTDREHVTPWMRRNGSRALVVNPGETHTKYKLSIDTQADMDLARRIVERLEPGNYAIDHTVAVAKEALQHVPSQTAHA